MKKIVECIPNFSEGRRKEVVDAIASALAGRPGVALLDLEMDGAHNRCVLTAAGAPEAGWRACARGHRLATGMSRNRPCHR